MITFARNTRPGLLLSVMVARCGLTRRLLETLVGAEAVLLLCFRRTGSDSLLVKAGRAGMLGDVNWAAWTEPAGWGCGGQACLIRAGVLGIREMRISACSGECGCL